MLSVYFLLLFLIPISAIQLGCISNATFISTDVTLIQTNCTLDQCVCYQWYHNFSGFNYFANNQTCELFLTFTTNFTLVANTSTRFCFSNQPTRKNGSTSRITTETTVPITTKSTSLASSIITTTERHSTTYPQTTSVLTSSKAYTTILPDITTAVNGPKWNPIGITVARGYGNNSIAPPFSVFVDDQYYIYIAEKNNNRISKWPPNPNGSASAANFQTANGQLNAPPSLYVNTKTGAIYVADESNNRVVFFANGSTTGSNVASSVSPAPITVNAIYLDPNGTIFVTDTNGHRIYNWKTNQTVVGGNGLGANAIQLNTPKRFFIDSNYSFYIADSNNHRIQKWLRGATSGVTVAGGYGQGPNASQLNAPGSVAVDSQGNVFVCDSDNHRVQKWSPNATTGQTIAGNANSTLGAGPNELNTPKGIALDKDNNLYVADYNNYRIQKFNRL